MNYKKIYDDLILKRTSDPAKVNVEKHHIIPKCIGGSNDSDNIVCLTAREHFIAHVLLCKIYPNSGKLFYAANIMTASNRHQKRNTARYYEFIKIMVRKLISAERKNKTLIHDKKTKKCISYPNHAVIPIGYESGSGKQNNLNKIRFYNSYTDIEIAIPETENPPPGFIKGRRPFTRLYNRNGVMRWDDGTTYDPSEWFLENPVDIKIVNIKSGDVYLIKSVDKVEYGYVISKTTETRNINCIHLVTSNSAVLTLPEYNDNPLWVRTHLKHNKVLYKTDIGIVRNKDEYLRKTGRSINLKKYCYSNNSIISDWLVNRSNLPKLWVGRSWEELGFDIILY